MKSYVAGPRPVLLTCLMGLAVVAALTGCGPRNYAVRSEQISPEHFEIAHRHPGTVAVTVDGGWDTPFLGLQLMPNEAVMGGLENALRTSGLFDGIAADGQGDYQLSVFVFDIDQPVIGAGDVTVNVEMTYTLLRPGTGRPIWRESVETTHMTKADAAYSLMERVHIASEAATKDNIRTAIERMSRLELPGRY